ncbi:MAG: alpha/beta hydrolase [Desulfuromonadales bacterium]|nr:alpha/beta hydrolase [Desulfuromonadales bacterium]
MSSTKVEEFRVEVPGGSLYAKKWTPESESTKSPLVLLHDSLGSVDLWRDVPATLAEHLSRSIVAYDRLGFGHSDARDGLPSDDFIEEEAITYFPAVKEHLSLQNYVLLGYSVGGAMAINIAARDPDCRAVVTLSAQAFVEDRTLQGIRDAKRMFERPGQMERLEKWHGPRAKWVLHAWTDVWLSAAYANWSLAPIIGSVRCPVLAIHGENDEYGSSAFPRFIAENTGGGGSMLLIKNCGHIPHREKPRETIDAVKDFLADIS